MADQGLFQSSQHRPGLAHQLCHFHYLREATKPISDADRRAKKELKKRVRGVRPLERELKGRSDEEAKVVRASCQAVMSSLPGDGQPPLEAAGLRLHDRLQAIDASICRVEEKTASYRACPIATPDASRTEGDGITLAGHSASVRLVASSCPRGTAHEMCNEINS